MSYLDVLENGDKDYEESPIAGETNCAVCSNNLETEKVPSRTILKAVIICGGCKRPICSLCVCDFHYKLGPLCYPCFRAEQQKQQILSNKPF